MISSLYEMTSRHNDFFVICNVQLLLCARAVYWQRVPTSGLCSVWQWSIFHLESSHKQLGWRTTALSSWAKLICIMLTCCIAIKVVNFLYNKIVFSNALPGFHVLLHQIRTQFYTSSSVTIEMNHNSQEPLVKENFRKLSLTICEF